MAATRTSQQFIDKELALVSRMVRYTCEHQGHDRQGAELCLECAALIAYVEARLARCPYSEDKPTCRNCPIHCYRPAERDKIKEVMRYAVPALVKRGDLGALAHLLHGLKPAPKRPGAK